MLTRIKKQPPLFFIYLTIFVNIIGFGMVFPLLPFYAQKFNASETTIGLLASSFAIAQFLFSPLWGRISDRFGRKPIISISLAGLAVSYFLFGFAQNLWWLFILRFLQGVFSAASLPVAHSYVADVTSKEDRIKGMGKLGASLATGFIFGPAIGGGLSSISLAFPFFTASAIAVLNLIFVYYFLPESLSKKSEKLLLREGIFNIKHMYFGIKGELGSLFLLIFLWSMVITNFEVAIPLFTSGVLGISLLTLSLLFSITGTISALNQAVLVHKLTRIFGEHRVAVLGLFIAALSLFLMPFSTMPTLLVLMSILSFGTSSARPTIVTLVSKQTKEGQGTAMGIFSSFESLGRVLGPIIGGWLYSNFGFHSPFTVTALVIIATLIFIVKFKKFLHHQN